MQTVTLRDVAQAAGVSQATASRVLSGNPATSAVAREKVQAAAAQLGFSPNAQARSLRSTRTDSIALLISDVRNPYFADLAHSVELAARELGLVTFIGNANEDPEQQDEFLGAMLSRRVDGVLAVPQGLGDASHATATPALERLLARRIPTVLVDRTLPEVPALSVTAESTQAVHSAVGALHELGHRRIAVIGGPEHTSTAQERYASYAAALQAHGLPLDQRLIFHGDFRSATGAEGARWLLELRQDPETCPTAVLIADSPMAIGALAVLREAGVRIGTDLSVVTFDEIEAFALHDPPLSTISHDVGAMGRLAVEALASLLNGEADQTAQTAETAVESSVLRSEFTCRGSVGPAPGAPTAGPTTVKTTAPTSPPPPAT
ncbi:LacI family DNA-binding transcriptional regulator [Zhihengliuella sp.]|uniref:LacI family DNA-binding transcriptional regulator n=1 Tax=Zhihengliuella sp. TaxID=1954483 RepID=UPI0028116D28|nr:LacI family DNA-binding transcriptional regulator [Zhihengliuella sp.]